MLLNKLQAAEVFEQYIKKSLTELPTPPKVSVPKDDSWGVYIKGQEFDIPNSFCGIDFLNDCVFLKLWDNPKHSEKRLEFLKHMPNTNGLNIWYEKNGIYYEKSFNSFQKWQDLKDAKHCCLYFDAYRNKDEIITSLNKMIIIFLKFCIWFGTGNIENFEFISNKSTQEKHKVMKAISNNIVNQPLTQDNSKILKKIEHNEMIAKLENLQNQHLVIISAFVSKVSLIIEKLLENGNKVDLYTGTLDYFNNPYYIKYLAEQARSNENFSLRVNFDPITSTHWKVYVVDSCVLYIGSANFTSVGICLKRDTLLEIQNGEICKEYLAETLNSVYTSSEVSDFDEKLDEYTETYKRISAKKFLYDEIIYDCEIPLFVSEENLDNIEKEISSNLNETLANKKGIVRFVLYYDCLLSPSQIVLNIDIGGKTADANYYKIIDIKEYKGDANDDYAGGFYIYAKKIRSDSKKVPICLNKNVLGGIKQHLNELKKREETEGFVTKKQLEEWAKN